MYFAHALVCQGVADAIGAPFEFGTPTSKDVLAAMKNQRLLEITDDTQMTLFTAQALTNVLSKFGVGFSTADFKSEVTLQYLKWFVTQTDYPHNHKDGLLKYPQLFSRRAPGNACLGSLSLQFSCRDHTGFASSRFGCGAVMRLLPFAFLRGHVADERIADLIQVSMSVTHGDPRLGGVTATFLSAVIEAMDTGTVTANTTVPVAQLGKGWYSDECLDMALSSVARSETYTDMLVQSIAHPGDSDSVAAVAGAFWGLTCRATPELATLAPRLAELQILLDVAYDFEQVLSNL